MNIKSKIIRNAIELTQTEAIQSTGNRKNKIIRRIFSSGVFSLLLLSVVIYTLPMTVLTVSSLLEYAIIVTLVIFLLILLIRYFGILILAYLYLNEYTFKKNDNFKPFISIIIPVFNEGKVLEKTIGSLLDLNYSNYEIIIVNDGSTDNTKEIAEQLIGYRNGIYKKIKVSLINKYLVPSISFAWMAIRSYLQIV
jgi:cellulose synthase/poly-beta-1,6-N-acetylglucosamine synthase-like glycosyltransferase